MTDSDRTIKHADTGNTDTGTPGKDLVAARNGGTMLSTTVAMATKTSKSGSKGRIHVGIPELRIIENGVNEISELRDGFEPTMREVKSDTYPRRRRSASMAEATEHAYARLEQELQRAQTDLKLKDEEVEKLMHVRERMGEELEDLTASLFEEANNMVQDANIKRMHSEKLLNEANTKIEMLQAEVSALKALVITSTPSKPNRHLHPQIDSVGVNVGATGNKKGNESPKLFSKGHKRSTSHHDISSNDLKKNGEVDKNIDSAVTQNPKEVEPVYYQEFRAWKQSPTWGKDDPFLSRSHHEDIIPCLNFPNIELSKQVLEKVENNSLTVEPIPGNHGNGSVPRIRIGDTEHWHFISQSARNRIISACDFYTYIRYIQQGLVKCNEQDMYWHIMELKKQMALSRLGVS